MIRADCSIIIRTLNEARHLADLLSSIREQDYHQGCIEVILVDSGSTDITREIAAQFHCRILQLKREEFSFGRSLNAGCALARGQYLVFISGHCVPVDRNWLRTLVHPLHDAKVAISYGRQTGGKSTKFSEQALFLKYFPPQMQQEQGPFFCNNANLALRRSCWEQINFDETLTGLEDMHLAKQLWQAGWHITYSPTALVFHYHDEKWRQIKRRYEREALALQQILPEVQVQWHDALRYFLVGVLGDWSQAVQQGVFWSKSAEIVAFRFCQFYGVWRGNHIHRQLSRREKDRYFYPR